MNSAYVDYNICTQNNKCIIAHGSHTLNSEHYAQWDKNILTKKLSFSLKKFIFGILAHSAQ